MADTPACAGCGRPVRRAACECGASWPSTRRAYGWLAAGVVSLPVSLGAAYAAWTLAQRTVFVRPHLGPEGTATGAVLVGAATLGALAAPALLSRSLALLRRRHDAIDAAPTKGRRLANTADAVAARTGAVPDRLLDRIPLLLVGAGVLLWVLAYAAAGVLPRPVFITVVLAAWPTVPIGIALDACQRGENGWDAAWALFPYAAALVGLTYLIARWRPRSR